MNVGAVIVTHNNANDIARCIESLKDQEIDNIIIVDNASTDSTVGALKILPVQVILNCENRGFAAAANQGAKQIRRDYILFVNPDTRLQGSIMPAITYLDTHQNTAILGLQLCDMNGVPEQYNYGAEVTPFSLITRHWRNNHLPITNYQLPVTVAWTSGGAMVVHREAFEKLDGFDEHFFMYWEDVDVCRRARGKGYQVVFFPGIRVFHRRGRSLSDIQQRTRIYDKSADRYFRKYYPTLICSVLHMARRIYRFFSPLAH